MVGENRFQITDYGLRMWASLGGDSWCSFDLKCRVISKCLITDVKRKFAIFDTISQHISCQQKLLDIRSADYV